jgi:hypothetical protein
LKKKLKQWKTTVNKPAHPSLGVNNLQRGQEKALEAGKELGQTAPVKEGMPAPVVPAFERQPPKLVPALGAQKDTQPGKIHRDLQREQNLPVQKQRSTPRQTKSRVTANPAEAAMLKWRATVKANCTTEDLECRCKQKLMR